MGRTFAKALLSITLAALALGPTTATAGACIAGGCHRPIVSMKYIHGPVAAEEAGAEGCVSCHTPAGAPCSASKGGKFTFKTKEDRLCLLCHERGTGTQHTRTRINCLSCHAPHGSDQSAILMRASGG